MRFLVSLVLTLRIFIANADAAEQQFRLAGEWTASQTNGATIRYIFHPNNEVTWIFQEPGKAADRCHAYFTVEGQNPFNLDIHDFDLPKLRGVVFQGIVEVLSASEFRIDAVPSHIGPRPTSFGTNTMVFVRKPSAVSEGKAVRLDGTSFSNVVVETINEKTVTFSHARGVASFNVARLSAAEREALGVPEPQSARAPAPEPRKLDVSNVPLSGRTILKVIFYSLFCLVAPMLIALAATLVRVEDISVGRCVKAGGGGLLAFVSGFFCAVLLKSPAWALAVMCIIWMLSIQMALKTSLIKATAVWLMTHGTLALAFFILGRFVNIQAGLLQLLAKK